METKLKDVLHLYIGCETTQGTLIEVRKSGHCTTYKNIYLKGDINEIKPILRSLSDITEFEIIQLMALSTGDVNVFRADNPNTHKFSARQFVYLLQLGFDLFGLIESDQAILKKN